MLELTTGKIYRDRFWGESLGWIVEPEPNSETGAGHYVLFIYSRRSG